MQHSSMNSLVILYDGPVFDGVYVIVAVCRCNTILEGTAFDHTRAYRMLERKLAQHARAL